MDGIAMTNSRGTNALYQGGLCNYSQRVTVNSWRLECAIANVGNPCVGASLVHGCNLAGVLRDIFTNGRFIVGTRRFRSSAQSGLRTSL